VTRPVLVLVGISGAGKTTVGEVVAAKLGVAVRDTDADIAAAAGKPIADIFVDDGEPAFRALEAGAVARALAEHDGVVVLGAGAVMAPETRERLRGHRVVHLAVTLPNALHRTGLSRDRPLLAINPRAQLRAMMADRIPLYEQVAAITVDTDDRAPEQVAEDLVALLAQTP
jgi:shikimate kinase